MPELPEVETIVRGLRPHLVGRAISRVIAADRRVLRSPRARFDKLAGRAIDAVERVGKYIRIIIGRRELILTIHLGMAGRLLVVPAGTPTVKHAYLRVAVAGEPGGQSEAELRLVNYRWCMGGVWLSRPGDADAPASQLGPDPLIISEDDFVAVLARRRQIKALLLDQTVLAGVGNIYADESLFQAGIHPRAVAARLSRERRLRLLEALRDRLNDSIARGGSSIRDYRDADGNAGYFQLTLKVYGRAGEPCPTCGRPIRHNVTAGRSTHFCPRCQRQPLA